MRSGANPRVTDTLRETQGDAAKTLKMRYKIEGRDDALKSMAGALEAFVGSAAN